MTAIFDPAELLAETVRHFPQLEKATIAPIEKGGSDRRFYRIGAGGPDSLVLIKYNSERAENRHYVQVARFLSEHGIRAPKIYRHDSEQNLIWMEDLGADDLWSHRAKSWAERRPLYQSALAEAAKLHRLAPSTADKIRADLPPPFDLELYRWEQRYFFDNCLGQHLGMSERSRQELAELPALRKIATHLASLPRVLVHRDFQSQNIMVRDGRAWLIDFQGMRFGLAAYDIASLLYDPYVKLAEVERDDLLGESGAVSETKELVKCCAMQRLMQALGAYGYLGLVRGNRSFLEHVPAALASLRLILPGISGTERLQEALSEIG